MAGRGVVPKDPEKLLGHHPPQHITELGDAPTDVPKMPTITDPDPRTLEWWDTWVTSPQAGQFMATDWLRLKMLVPLIDAYFKSPSPSRMAEVRMNEQRLGATPEDRQRLRWRQASTGEAAPVPAAPPKQTKKKRRADPRLRVVKGSGR